MLKVMLVVGAATLVLAGAAEAAPVSAQIAPAVVSKDVYLKHNAAYPGGVTGHPDITYAAVNGYRPMTLDLYVPSPGKTLKPLAIYVHGGGWTGGTARNAGAFADFPGVLASLAARGYVVASLNSRLSGEARFPAAADDVDAAIRWLKAHAKDYGIDKARVAIWGGSAGGQLAALAATDCSPAEAGKDSDCVQSAVIWYGVFDFAALPQRAPPPGQPDAPNAYLGCRIAECPQVVAAASPIAHVDAKTPPMLLIFGSEDKTVPPAQSRAMAVKLKSAGVRSEVIEIPGVDHSFIGHTPEATRAASLKALQATFDFFDATVGKP
jgi:acetyl esterase/lipase